MPTAAAAAVDAVEINAALTSRREMLLMDARR